MDTQHEHATPQNDRKHGTPPAATGNAPIDAETERKIAAQLLKIADRIDALADRLEGTVTK